ncbi:thioredoxin (plasmid) [Rossellomorea sp. AcN35-11]|nr:thioredoxin [Rossellomorea aquimaris]WJV32173.1 thioredoxin [Rossellomorea sp. AcN35-11]
MKNVTDVTLEQELKEGLVLLDFWAPWCGPCKMITPVLEELDKEMGDKVKILKINVDENKDSVQKYDVMSIPTMVLFKDGEKVDHLIGFQPKELLVSMIEKYS